MKIKRLKNSAGFLHRYLGEVELKAIPEGNCAEEGFFFESLYRVYITIPETALIITNDRGQRFMVPIVSIVEDVFTFEGEGISDPEEVLP